jgi:hypothetical protein
MSASSDRFEQTVRNILEQCRDALGYSRVDPKGKLPGRSGTEWEIDSTAYLATSGDMVLVECRWRSKKRIDQEQIGGLVFRVQDTGAVAGLMVTSIGLQKGAELVAQANQIGIAKINPDATDRDYVLDIAGRLFHGIEAKGGLRVSGAALNSVNHNIIGSGGLGLG